MAAQSAGAQLEVVAEIQSENVMPDTVTQTTC